MKHPRQLTTHQMLDIPYSWWMSRNNQVETPDYNTRQAHMLGYEKDETGHLPTVDSSSLKFLKHKRHPTTQMEIDWFNSEDPSAIDFRKNYQLDDTDPDYFKYTPIQMGNGGPVNNNNMLREFNEGGSHQQNPLGGIPLGANGNGRPVTVEEGETAMNTKQGDFVFSDRIKIDDRVVKALNLPKNFKGKTMADASKFINNKFTDRNDAISNSTKEKMLTSLADTQEAIKTEMQMKHAATMQANSTEMDPTGPVPPGMESMSPMAGGGFTSFANNYGAATGAVAGVGSGLFGDSTNGEEVVNGQQNGHIVNNTTRTWESTKDAVATAYPIAGLFRGVEKLGKSAGQAVGGDSGGDFMGGFLDPMSNKMDKDTSFLEKVGGIDPLFAGMLARKKNAERREKQGKIEAYQESQMYADDYALGGNIGRLPVNRNLTEDINYQLNLLNTNPTMRAQKALVDNGYKVDVDGKWGPKSIKAQQALAKAAGVNLGKATTPNNDLLGLTEEGLSINPYDVFNPNRGAPLDYSGQFGSEDYKPWSDTPTDIQQGNIDAKALPVSETSSSTDNKGRFGSFARYAPVIANALQLNSLEKPFKDTPILTQGQANRRYVDEAGILRNADNAQNSTVRALSENGMSGGALRGSILAAQLNRQRGLSDAYGQAQNMNRQVDEQADAINREMALRNSSERMRVKENYDRDMGAFETRRSQLSSQLGTDVGNIGREETYKDMATEATGYTWDGQYYTNKSGDKLTGSQYYQLFKRKPTTNNDSTTDEKSIGGYIFRK